MLGEVVARQKLAREFFDMRSYIAVGLLEWGTLCEGMNKKSEPLGHLNRHSVNEYCGK